MRSFTVHPASLALGLVLSGIALLSMSQVGVPGTSWGPPKKDIVNLFRFDQSALITVAPTTTHAIYTVPSDRWLTVTAMNVQASAPASGYPRVSEEFGGVRTQKGLALFSTYTDLPLRSPHSAGG